MAYPSDVYVSPNAKYFGFVDTGKPFNPHWDITWSITYALTGTDHAFCTFLTTTPSISTAIPGHYLGYLGDYPYLLSENGEILYSETPKRLVIDDSAPLQYENTGVLAVAFDSTGYFALSTPTTVGVSMSSVKKNSLIIRDCDNKIIFNEHLSVLDPDFVLAQSPRIYQTLRFRLTNAGTRLYVDYKAIGSSYEPLTSVDMTGFNPNVATPVYIGLTFCSPMSSNATPSTLFIRNFNYGGSSDPETYELVPAESIVPQTLEYTSFSKSF